MMTSSGSISINADQEEQPLAVKSSVIAYISQKLGHLPSDIVSIDQYESLDGSLSIETLQIEFGSIWTIRFSEPDDQTPGRSWSVEISVGELNNEILVGFRLNCFSRNYDFDFDNSVPRILRSLVNMFSYSDYGYKLSQNAITIQSNSDSEFLYDLINNTKRWRNIVAVSCDENFDSLVDYNGLAYKLSGVAHVVAINPSASFHLSSLLGKELSVFDRGVRTYRPSFSEEDQPTRHPLILRRQIDKVPVITRRKFEEAIRRDCFRMSIERDGLARVVPSFVDIRLAASKARLTALGHHNSSNDDLVRAEIEARKAAESQSEAAMSMALQEEELRKEIESERDNYRAQLYAIRDRVEALEHRLSVAGEQLETGTRPASYDEISPWVEQNFSGKLVLHPRAKKALKNAAYEDIGVVCETLSLLANEYRKVCLGEMRKEEFDSVISNKHLDMSGSISEERAKEFNEEYFINWRGNKSFLHGHIQKGNSRDERYCLRVYFLWEPEDSLIVVGWLPSHLTNRLT
ncbi:hypothetical protein BPNPMPFG_002618 [Mesorhizobium sp. AR07]|uniref:hypothetical protein n=1 Tax=Mesorhizobium sp. AR07 TaxID=2865838 RepID=UPI00215EE11D|nr:hypothetical protein [Mesorhizobium sp. AR07]UVK46895.1 hypothetical protein BPNPMPFG_002618 [Mesorhizobium sp. AR07]